jgi:hypothetical protein
MTFKIMTLIVKIKYITFCLKTLSKYVVGLSVNMLFLLLFIELEQALKMFIKMTTRGQNIKCYSKLRFKIVP